MTCGATLVYGRSFLNPRFLMSSLTSTLFAERR
jgi:polysaccharide transporter, PST family